MVKKFRSSLFSAALCMVTVSHTWLCSLLVSPFFAVVVFYLTLQALHSYRSCSLWCWRVQYVVAFLTICDYCLCWFSAFCFVLFFNFLFLSSFTFLPSFWRCFFLLFLHLCCDISESQCASGLCVVRLAWLTRSDTVDVYRHCSPPLSLIFSGGANGSYVRSVSFCRDGRHVTTVCDDGSVFCWAFL